MTAFSFNSYEDYQKSKSSKEAWFKNRKKEINDKTFQKEYYGMPIDKVSDSLRVEGMHKKILRLEDRINSYSLAKTALEADNIDLKKMNKELIEENQELRIKVEKIRSRFDILDL